VYKATRGLAPSYIADMCIAVTTVSTRQSLRSAARGDLLVPRTQVKFSNRAFMVACPERGTACQSTSGHLIPSLPSRTVSRHICLNCHTAVYWRFIWRW